VSVGGLVSLAPPCRLACLSCRLVPKSGTRKLLFEEVEETVQNIALLHAADLAYRLVPNSVGWWLLRRSFSSPASSAG
jgi:hypothetical protein